jgi:hypothetical protein
VKEDASEFMQNIATESQGRWQAMERLLSAADVSKVFGAPVTTGQHTVITASEVGSGGGLVPGWGSACRARVELGPRRSRERAKRPRLSAPPVKGPAEEGAEAADPWDGRWPPSSSLLTGSR